MQMTFETQPCHSFTSLSLSSALCQTLTSNLPPECNLGRVVRMCKQSVLNSCCGHTQTELWEVASGGQYDPHKVWVGGGADQLHLCSCLCHWCFDSDSVISPNSPPFQYVVSLQNPPASSWSPSQLPDVREVWEEPGGVCVPQGPLFLLNWRETLHVLQNLICAHTPHTHTLS